MSGALEFDVRLHMEQLSKDIQAINNKINGFVENTKKGAGEIDTQFNKIAGLIAGYFSLNFAGNLVRQIAMVRGEFQQLEVAFRTMLGNKAMADELMAQVVEFAAITPFELKDVASGAKSLLAFGVSAEDLIPTLKSLGDVSAGLSVPIERLILNFGQVKTQAQLTGRELRDFNVAGVPIIAELSKNLGVAEEKIADMVSAGNIGFADVAKAFQTMTQEGGRFANLMYEQSKTITGQISNLKDAWNQMLNDIGKSNEGAIGGALKIAKELVENYETVISVLKILVATYGAYKTAVIVASIAMKASDLPGFVKQLQALNTAIKAATTSWKTMEAAQKATIWGLAIAGITALITSLTLFKSKTEDAAKSVADFESNLIEEKKAMNVLFNQLKNTTEGTDDRRDAIKRVNDKYGDYLKNLLTEKSTLQEIEKAQNLVTDALKRTMQIKIQETQLQPYKENFSDALINYNNQLQNLTKGMTEAQKSSFTALMYNFENNVLDQVNETGKIFGSLAPSISQIYKNVTDKELGTDKMLAISMAVYDIADAQKKLNEQTKIVSGEWEKYGGIIDKTTDKIDEANNKTKKSNKDVINELLNNYNAAVAKFNQMNSSNESYSDTELKTQQEVVKGLQEQLALRGIIVGKINKQEQERLKAAEELKNSLVELENQTQSARIAIMREGTEKQKKEVELQLKMELDAIDKQRKELDNKLKTSGLIPGTQQYETERQKYTSQYDEQEIIKKQETADKKIAIEIDLTKRTQELWDLATSVFETDQEKQLETIRLKYKDAIAEAEKANNFILAIQLGKAQQVEEDAIRQKRAESIIDLEHEIADTQVDIQNKSGEYSADAEKKKIQNAIDANNKKIALYEKTLTEENQLNIKALKNQNDALNTEMDKTGKVKAREVLQAFGEIVSTVSEIDPELGKALQTMNELAQSGYNLVLAFKAKDAFGTVSSAFAFISSLYEATLGQKESALDSYNSKLNYSNHLLEMQGALLSKLAGEDWFQMAEKQIKSYDQQIENSRNTLVARLMNMEKYVNMAGGNMNYPSGYQGWDIQQFYDAWIAGTIKLTDEQEKLLTDAYSNLQERADLMDTVWDKVTGSSRDSIADGLIDGFKQGFDSAEDFASNFEELMKNAVMNVMKTQIMNGPLMSWYESFAEAGEGGYTQAEIDSLRASWDAMITASQKIMDDISSVSGLDFTSGTTGKDALTQSIKGMTEEQAGIISGQFYAMRENLAKLLYNSNQWTQTDAPVMLTAIKNVTDSNSKLYLNAVQQLDIANRSMTHLAKIESNTADIALLNATNSKLDEMNKYIKQLI